MQAYDNPEYSTSLNMEEAHIERKEFHVVSSLGITTGFQEFYKKWRQEEYLTKREI